MNFYPSNRPKAYCDLIEMLDYNVYFIFNKINIFIISFFIPKVYAHSVKL